MVPLYKEDIQKVSLLCFEIIDNEFKQIKHTQNSISIEIEHRYNN